MTSQQFDEILSKARRLEDRFQNVAEHTDSAEARSFRANLHSFKEAVESEEDSSRLSDKAERVADQADRIKHMSTEQQPVMNSSEAQQFKEEFMRLRDMLRSM